MSFLWHGLTDQGSQVPIQVDVLGRVIAVDGTPGGSKWTRTGTTLTPSIPGDDVDLGSGDLFATRVGVGTTSPSANLHVSASSSTTVKVTETNNGVTGALQATSIGPALGSDTNHPLTFYTNSVEAARIDSDGRLLVGTFTAPGTTSGALLQVNGDRVRIATAKTPASASDTGTVGEVCWDTSYIYVCTATNTWKRSALSAW